MFELDRVRTEKLETEYYDKAIMYMDDSYRYSTYHAFHRTPFFNMLTPKLQMKLVKETCDHQFKKLRFFFNNYTQGIRAPSRFVMHVLCSLTAQVLETG